MTQDARRARIEALFDEALDRPTAERGAWLDAHDAAPSVRREVRALLDAHDVPHALLDAGLPRAALTLVDDPLRGRRVGPYRLLRELGRGGMGVVYLAERDDGQYRRRVALKLLRAGPDADELRRRFVAERQILASLSHPNIAQLLDGGVTDGQLPYLVMEYVDGVPITEYCDRHRLDVRARVALVRDICAAVHHAHQNLVIHRDLKPSNVLVTADGAVKLLDFGIAKLLNPVLGWEQPLTRTDLRILTPEYASPEQLRGDSLTTASDVYALGVVLYELLCGQRPFATTGASPQELAARARGREPERPSARANERAARQLRGDLDAIVLCALRPEPTRRYGSAELLSQDLQRWLDALPVLAHRGSRAYRLRKLVARHRGTATAAALVLVSLAAGTTVAVREAARARHARDLAEAARRDAEDATRFLVGLFEGVPAPGGGSDSVSAGELLRRGVARIPRVAATPDAQSRLLVATSLVYRNLARYEEAATLLERAVALAHGDAARADRASALFQLAEVRRFQGRHGEAERLALEALALRRAALGERNQDVATSLHQLARFAVYRAQLPVAESYARRTLALRQSVFGATHRDVAMAQWTLASTLARRGRTDEAERTAREALATYERLEGPNGASVAFMLLRLGDLAEQQREDETTALELRRRAERVLVTTLGDDDPGLSNARTEIALALARRGEAAEAERLMQRVLDVMVRTVGPSHPDVALTLSEQAEVLRRAGDYVEAERVMRRSVAMWERYMGRRHNAWLGALGGLAQIVASRGRLGEADSLLALALTIRRDSVGDRASPSVAILLGQIGALRTAQHRYTESDSLYREARTLWLRHTTERHHDVRAVDAGLAQLHERLGHTEEAARWRRLAGGRRPTFELPDRK